MKQQPSIFYQQKVLHLFSSSDPTHPIDVNQKKFMINFKGQKSLWFQTSKEKNMQDPKKAKKDSKGGGGRSC